MLWIKAFHIIFMVAWFSGLFYLPRLFVYHTQAADLVSQERFKIMENKLFYFITTPAALLTLLFGFWLMSFNLVSYVQALWMQIKLGMVGLLIIYHIYLGKLLHQFKHNCNTHTATFYRWLNEIPTLFLLLIVLLVVLKPF